MKKILIFGAGMSAWYAIKYLADNAQAKQWQISVADASQGNLDACKNDFPNVKTILADVFKDEEREALVSSNDIVISLLPARFHILIANDCVRFGVHLITPSYVTNEMNRLNAAASSKNITILNEIGLDPGIDHLSSMNIIHRLKDDGANITSYKSFCGGLVSLDSSDNPWQYKFTWNPYNVIRAGSDGAVYKSDNQFKYIPYHHLFKEIQSVSFRSVGTQTEERRSSGLSGDRPGSEERERSVESEAAGEYFDMYLNRDSTRYTILYGLEEVPTFLRGTLRYPGFCKKWASLIDAGLTSDKIEITIPEMNWSRYLKGFSHEELTDPEVIQAWEWLVQDAGNIALVSATPAANLQKLLETKWKMNPNDKDRVVMLHEFGFEKGGIKYMLKSYMEAIGENATKTAMAKTVGLPLAIAAGLIADGVIKTFGVILPVIPEVYKPLLEALAVEGISFKEELSVIS